MVHLAPLADRFESTEYVNGKAAGFGQALEARLDAETASGDARPAPKQAGRTINDLPYEILEMGIMPRLFHFEAPFSLSRRTTATFVEQRKVLYSLCLASRRLRWAAEPLLYHTYLHDNRQPSLRPFLRTLIDRPELAHHVKRIHVGRYNGLSRRELLAREYGRMFVGAAKRMALSFEQDWIEAMIRGVPSAEFALLLCQTTRLEELDLVIPGVWREEKSFIRMLFVEPRLQDREAHHFRWLKNIRLKSFVFDFGFDPQLFAAIRRLPALEFLNRSDSEDDPPAQVWWKQCEDGAGCHE